MKSIRTIFTAFTATFLMALLVFSLELHQTTVGNI